VFTLMALQWMERPTGLNFGREEQAWRHVTEAGSGLGDIEVADIETSKDG